MLALIILNAILLVVNIVLTVYIFVFLTARRMIRELNRHTMWTEEFVENWRVNMLTDAQERNDENE